MFSFDIFDSKKMPPFQITCSLSKKLEELKETLAEEFGVSREQRLFYMGRELKNGGRSLQRLGLGKSGKNSTLHMHIPPTIIAAASKSGVSGSKRRRSPVVLPSSINQVSSSSSNGAGPTSVQEGIIEIVDSDDDEVLKRRR